ncbi:MAG TPA: lytic transglycosylase domain-containing protein, partial [Thermoanaerobaculia bacterium]
RLRHHAGAIAIGVPLALGAVIVPVKTLTAAAETRTASVARQTLQSIELQRRERPWIIAPIASRPQRDIRATARLIDDLALETVRQHVFFNEIPYGPIIYREAKRHGFAPELIAAVVEVESNFRPTLVSPKNAQGLMQIVPPTGIFMEANDLLDPADNIAAGVRYLRYLARRTSDLRLVLAAYNAGEGNVERFGGIPPSARRTTTSSAWRDLAFVTSNESQSDWRRSKEKRARPSQSPKRRALRGRLRFVPIARTGNIISP